MFDVHCLEINRYTVVFLIDDHDKSPCFNMANCSNFNAQRGITFRV